MTVTLLPWVALVLGPLGTAGQAPSMVDVAGATTVAQATVFHEFGFYSTEATDPDSSPSKDGNQEPLSDLDRQLLDDLDDKPLDGLHDSTSKSRFKAGHHERPDDESRPLEDALKRELGKDAEPTDAEPPLARIGDNMRRVESLIQRRQFDEKTQQLQKNIVDALDSLIKQAQQNRGQSSSSQQKSKNRSRREQVRPSGTKPGPANTANQQPARNSEARAGKEKVRHADPRETRKMMEELWGHLPQRLRQQVINSSIEEFLPDYELQIEQYFKRLSEELQDSP